MIRSIVLLLLVFTLASCKLPSLVPPAGSPGGPGIANPSALRLEGRIAMPPSVQATLGDVASHATVALIDAVTRHTLATTVTNESGAFFLQFAEGFVPVADRPYFLEALKGVRGENPDFNQAGADTIRLRTLIFYRPAERGWVSLDNAEPGSVFLSMNTTAVSVAIAHMTQAGDTLDPAAFIGSVQTGTYVPADRPLSLNAFTGLRTEVEKAILENRDPFHYVVYDRKNGTFQSSFVAFAVSEILPLNGNIGTLVDIRGDGFLSGTLEAVLINGKPAEVQPGSLADDRVLVKVLPGTRTGPVSLVINGVVQAGPTFTVTMTDGHRSIANDRLFVANPSWGTVAEVALNGEIRTLVSGLATPMQAVVGPDGKIYVSCAGGQVVRFNKNGSGLETVSTAVASPYGLAFDLSGRLYVSNRQVAGSVSRLKADGTIDATFVGFTQPGAIAFDAQGHLFVAEAAGAIRRLPAGSTTSEYYTGVPFPMGLAIDSAGDLYVASNQNSVVYRIGSNRAQTVFAMLNKPGGLTFDEKGNLYVSDTERNLINRISPLGDVRVIAYGISHPRGLAVDPATSKVYIALSRSNAILEIQGGVLRPFVTGIANPLTLTFRNNGLYVGQPEIDTVSFVTTGGQMRTVASGINEASGADVATDGTVYAGRWGREDAWQPNRRPIYEGGFQAIAPGDILQPIRYPYVRDTRFRLVMPDETLYESSTDRKSISRIIPHANGSRTVESLFMSETEAPRHIAIDAAGTVYSSFLDQHKVMRFKPPNYVPETVATGLSQPFGLALDPGADALSVADDRLYVYNRGTSRLSWINNPSAAAAVSGQSAGTSTAVATGPNVYGMALSLKPGDDGLYFAANTTIMRYDVSDDAFAAYVTDLPLSVVEIKAWPDGTLFTRPENEHLVTISPTKDVTRSKLRNYGGAKTWKDDGARTRFENNSYGAQVWRDNTLFYGAIGKTFEVAVDGGTYLYLAGAGTSGDANTDYGGVFRYELQGARPKELYVPIPGGRVYSLAIAADRTVYAGAGNGTIYAVDLAGAVTSKWALGTLPFGLDRSGTTLWAVGANSRIFSFPLTLPAGDPPPSSTYGIMEPVF